VDLAFTRSLQSVASDPLDILANANTPFGQALVSVLLAAALALVAWRREPPMAWLAMLLFGGVVVVGLVLKLVLVHPPPTHEYVRALWNPLGVGISTPSGFPSGHIARMTFLAIVGAALFRAQPIRIALALFVGYTFWARVYIGDHWLSDAIGGLALGVAAGSLAWMWIERCRDAGRS